MTEYITSEHIHTYQFVCVLVDWRFLFFYQIISEVSKMFFVIDFASIMALRCRSVVDRIFYCQLI